MSRPIYRWRLDELESISNRYRDPETGDVLKVQTDEYQIWLLADGVTVREEVRQDDKSWKVAETYEARPKPENSGL